MKTAKPFKFFLGTYFWSWLLWAPFVLAGMGLYSLDGDFYATISFPVLMLGAFGPAVGALFCVYNESGREGLILSKDSPWNN